MKVQILLTMVDGNKLLGFFSEIYMKAHPYRAAELVQYHHLIHIASQSFVLDNVYLYDKDFQIHMSKHTNHSWAIILQQVWMVRLHDRIKNVNNTGNDGAKKSSELCKQLNKTGRCTYGASCKYEHRCSYCFKYSHGAYNCRKLKADHGYRRSGGGRRHYHNDF